VVIGDPNGIGVQGHRARHAAAESNGRRVSGVDDPRGPRAEINSNELARDEAPCLIRVRRERFLREPGLVGKSDTSATRVAQRAYEDCREQSRVERVPHRVG
jgi:hypothetical protein